MQNPPPTTQTITVDLVQGNIVTTGGTITEPSGSTVTINWALTTNISTINSITAPTAPCLPPLNTPTQIDGVWTLQDTLGNTLTTYSYTMTVNDTITQDPQIVNNPTGG